MASMLPRFHIGDKLAETFSRQSSIHEDVLQLEDGRYVGYLEKQGRARNQFSVSALKSWTLRYVVLKASTGVMEYYTDQRDFQRGVHAKGRLHIHGAFLNRLSQQGAGAGKTQAFSITVQKHSGDEETLVFNAMSDVQLEQWLMVFKITIAGEAVDFNESSATGHYSEDRTGIDDNHSKGGRSRYPGREQRQQTRYPGREEQGGRAASQNINNPGKISSMAIPQSKGTLIAEGSEDIVQLDNIHGDDMVGGYLLKKGRSRNLSFTKSWSTRFFTVDSSTSVLRYFANQREMNDGHLPRGQLSLIGAGLEHVDSVGDKQFCFEVSVNKHDGSVENLTLCAFSHNHFDTWWQILAHVITGGAISRPEEELQQYEDEYDDDDYVNEKALDKVSTGITSIEQQHQLQPVRKQSEVRSADFHQSQYELYQKHKLSQEGNSKSSTASSTVTATTHPPPPYSPPSMGKMEGKVIDKQAARKMFAPPTSPPGVANVVTSNVMVSSVSASTLDRPANAEEMDRTLQNTRAELERVREENDQLRKLLGLEGSRVKELEGELDHVNNLLDQSIKELQLLKNSRNSNAVNPSAKTMLPPKSPKDTGLHRTKVASDGIADQSGVLELDVDHLDDYEIPDVAPSPLPSSKDSDAGSLVMSPSPSPNKRKLVLSSLPTKPATIETASTDVVSEKERLRLQLDKEMQLEKERQENLRIQRQKHIEEEEKRLAAEEAHRQWLAAEKQRQLEEEIAAAEERERIEEEIREKRQREERLLAKKKEEEVKLEAKRLKAEQDRLEAEKAAREKQRLVEEAEKEKERRLKELEEESERERARLEATLKAKREEAEKELADRTAMLHTNQRKEESIVHVANIPKESKEILIEVDLGEGKIGKLIAHPDSEVGELVDRFLGKYSLSVQYREPLAAYVAEIMEAAKAEQEDEEDDYDEDFEEDFEDESDHNKGNNGARNTTGAKEDDVEEVEEHAVNHDDDEEYGGVVVDVDLGNGSTGHLVVFKDSNLEDVARNFLRANDLADAYYDVVMCYITECQNSIKAEFEAKSPKKHSVDKDIGEDGIQIEKFESVDQFESPEPLRLKTLGDTMATVSSLGGDSPISNASYLSTSRVISPSSSAVKTRRRRNSIPMSMELSMPSGLYSAVNSLPQLNKELKTASRISGSEKGTETTHGDMDDIFLTVSPSTASSASSKHESSHPVFRKVTSRRRQSTLDTMMQSTYTASPPSPPSNDHKSLTGENGADQVYNFSELSRTGAILPSTSTVNLPVERKNLAGTPNNKSASSHGNGSSRHDFGVGITSRMTTNAIEKPIINGNRRPSTQAQAASDARIL